MHADFSHTAPQSSHSNFRHSYVSVGCDTLIFLKREVEMIWQQTLEKIGQMNFTGMLAAIKEQESNRQYEKISFVRIIASQCIQRIHCPSIT